MSLKTRMTELKSLLQTEEKFNVISGAFFDIFNDAGFVQTGEKTENLLLSSMIEKMVDHLFPGSQMKIALIAHLPEFLFYHGLLFVNGLPCNFFYFSDIEMGMLTVTKDLKGQMSFVRFTGTQFAPGSFTVSRTSQITH